jgi:hypothetical protein
MDEGLPFHVGFGQAWQISPNWKLKVGDLNNLYIFAATLHFYLENHQRLLFKRVADPRPLLSLVFSESTDSARRTYQKVRGCVAMDAFGSSDEESVELRKLLGEMVSSEDDFEQHF